MPSTPWEITREMFLSVNEVRSLLTAVRRPPANELDRLIIEGLLWSGLRSSEFCNLRLADTIVGTGRPSLIVRTMNRADRIVHVPAHLCALIQHYVDEIRPSFLPNDVAADNLDQPFVFNERRRPYERTGLYRRVVRILTDAGLGSRASVQLLRHTYGYLAYLQTGGNLLFVQRQLGHAHPMVTAIYAQFVDEDYAALANEIGNLAPADAPETRNRHTKLEGVEHAH